MSMYMFTCVQKIRDKKNNIIGYILKDDCCSTFEVEPNKLKELLMYKKIHIDNLKITKDGRLITCRSDGSFVKHLLIEAETVKNRANEAKPKSQNSILKNIMNTLEKCMVAQSKEFKYGRFEIKTNNRYILYNYASITFILHVRDISRYKYIDESRTYWIAEVKLEINDEVIKLSIDKVVGFNRYDLPTSECIEYKISKHCTDEEFQNMIQIIIKHIESGAECYKYKYTGKRSGYFNW